MLKIFFCRTSLPISVKLCTNYPWIKRIQNCSNKGPHPFQSEDYNYKNAKIWCGLLKIFLRTTEPENFVYRYTSKLYDIMQIRVCNTVGGGSVVELLPREREVKTSSPARADGVKPNTLK
jgi:hypothetical protein